MNKILNFETNKDHYHADACVAWCFDDRFTPLLHEFEKQFAHFDLVRSAGGAKALAGGPSPERDFVIGQIKASLKLHETKQIVLMVHIDCGGYGGSKNFDNDHAKEVAHHEAELRTARDFVAQEIPGTPIQCLLADFDGLYEVV